MKEEFISLLSLVETAYIDLIKGEEYYEHTETLREVFGETFRNNLMCHIREQRQLVDDLAANTLKFAKCQLFNILRTRKSQNISCFGKTKSLGNLSSDNCKTFQKSIKELQRSF